MMMEKKKGGIYPRVTVEKLRKLPKPSDFKQPEPSFWTHGILKPAQQWSLLQFHTCGAAAVQPFREHCAEPLQHSRNLQFHWAQMNPDFTWTKCTKGTQGQVNQKGSRHYPLHLGNLSTLSVTL